MQNAETALYLVISLKNWRLALSSNYVREIVQIPLCHALPGFSHSVRGGIGIRGQMFSLLDLRRHLEVASLSADLQEMVTMFAARKQDHLRWISALEASISDKKPFTLARDPRKCAFGKWYYSYQAPNRAIASYLESFEIPHKRIHDIAEVVLTRAEAGEQEEALKILEETRAREFSVVVRLFDEAGAYFNKELSEIGVVLTEQWGNVAICVDSVDAVEQIEMVQDAPPVLNGQVKGFFSQTARRKGDNEILFILDPERLLQEIS
ncbi:MAG: chemotaxis protein CheW [Candidatus Ozemobacteraceae bacterium]